MLEEIKKEIEENTSSVLQSIVFSLVVIFLIVYSSEISIISKTEALNDRMDYVIENIQN